MNLAWNIWSPTSYKQFMLQGTYVAIAILGDSLYSL